MTRQRALAGPPTTAGDASKVDPESESPRVWYAMIGGSLEGPFSAESLAELRRRREVDDDSKVRRTGEVRWRRLAEVVDSVD